MWKVHVSVPLITLLYLYIWFLIFLYVNLTMQTSQQNIICEGMTGKWILYLNNYSIFSLLCHCGELVFSDGPQYALPLSKLELMYTFSVSGWKALLSQRPSLNCSFSSFILSSFYTFVLSLFIAYLLCAGHCSRYWRIQAKLLWSLPFWSL